MFKNGCFDLMKKTRSRSNYRRIVEWRKFNEVNVVESGFRSTDWQQLTFAVVGMGLIGGSYAKALRRLGRKEDHRCRY